MKKPGENYRESPGERYLVHIQIAIILLMITMPFFMLIIPTEIHPKAPALRVNCANNMRNLDLAVLNDSVNRQNLRPYSVDKEGKPLHSWRTLILPGIDQNALYRQIRPDEPWDSEYNRQFHDVVIPLFQCPSERDSNSPQTHYRMLVGQGSVFGDSNSIPYSTVEEISKNTGEDRPVLIIETSETVHWMCPDEVQYEDYMNGSVPPATPGHRNEVCLNCSIEGQGRQVPFHETILQPEFVIFFGFPAMLFVGTVVFCAVSYRKYLRARKDPDDPGA